MPKIWSPSNSRSIGSGWYWSAFDHELIDVRPGFLAFQIRGKNPLRSFCNESGGHRWQRVPPTEKRGRVHTSTVTVAVLEVPSESEIHIDPRDLTECFTRGQGAGGQHRNKTDTAVQLHHKPSGIAVRVDGGRSQHANRVTALGMLRAKLKALENGRAAEARAQSRRSQVGSGMRGDKRRTVAVQRDSVIDHETGKSIPFREYVRGRIERLVR